MLRTGRQPLRPAHSPSMPQRRVRCKQTPGLDRMVGALDDCQTVDAPPAGLEAANQGASAIERRRAQKKTRTTIPGPQTQLIRDGYMNNNYERQECRKAQAQSLLTGQSPCASPLNPACRTDAAPSLSTVCHSRTECSPTKATPASDTAESHSGQQRSQDLRVRSSSRSLHQVAAGDHNALHSTSTRRSTLHNNDFGGTLLLLERARSCHTDVSGFHSSSYDMIHKRYTMMPARRVDCQSVLHILKMLAFLDTRWNHRSCRKCHWHWYQSRRADCALHRPRIPSTLST